MLWKCNVLSRVCLLIIHILSLLLTYNSRDDFPTKNHFARKFLKSNFTRCLSKFTRCLSKRKIILRASARKLIFLKSNFTRYLSWRLSNASPEMHEFKSGATNYATTACCSRARRFWTRAFLKSIFTNYSYFILGFWHTTLARKMNFRLERHLVNWMSKIMMKNE